MNRWGNRNQQGEGLNFAVVFQQHPDAYYILHLNNIVEQMKSKSNKFTQKLVQPKYRPILYQIFQIAINPLLFVAKTQKQVDKKITHAAIQILSNLTEQFMQAVFESESAKEDEVVQTEKQYPIITYLFRILSEGQAEETGLAYFSKIITPFIYQKSQEMLRILNSQTNKTLLPYFWSSSVSEIVAKALEAESQKDFYQKQKLSFIKSICKSIASIDEVKSIEPIIESFGDLIQSFVQKHQDKYEKAKYANLLKSIVSEAQNFTFLVNYLQKYKDQKGIKTELLHCIQAYLRIHLPAKTNQKNYDQQTPSEPINLNKDFANTLKDYLSTHEVTQFISDLRLQILYYYKVIKIFLTLLPEATQTILTRNFLSSTLSLMKEDQNNNILHNFQKDIIIAGVKESVNVCRRVQNQIGLQQAIRATLSEKNSPSSYANQLFFIAQAAKTKSQQAKITPTSWNDLSQKIANKRNFYSVNIGGNRKGSQQIQKWDKFQNDIILKPLNTKEPQQKNQSPKRQKDPSRANIVMVTRLDDMQGTQVLSEQQQDPFNQKTDIKNCHIFDDLGMPQLPLDSDRSEEGENKNSLDQLPATLKEPSGVYIANTLPAGGQNSNIEKKQQQQQDPLNGLPENLGLYSDKVIKLAQQNGLLETIGQYSGKVIKLEDQDDLLPEIIGQESGEIIKLADSNGLPDNIGQNSGKITKLKQKPLVSLEEPKNIEANFIQNQINELTVSIELDAQQFNQPIEIVPCREQIQLQILIKYNLKLKKNQPK